MRIDSPQSANRNLLFGLYFRTGMRAHFWGWSEPAPKPPESHSVTLAEWLRMAHSSMFVSCDPAAPEQPGARNELQASPPVSVGTDASGPARRRFRFVCNRKVIGLEFR